MSIYHHSSSSHLLNRKNLLSSYHPPSSSMFHPVQKRDPGTPLQKREVFFFSLYFQIVIWTVVPCSFLKMSPAAQLSCLAVDLLYER
jgi:hypothetical protein